MLKLDAIVYVGINKNVKIKNMMTAESCILFKKF